MEIKYGNFEINNMVDVQKFLYIAGKVISYNCSNSKQLEGYATPENVSEILKVRAKRIRDLAILLDSEEMPLPQEAELLRIKKLADTIDYESKSLKSQYQVSPAVRKIFSELDILTIGYREKENTKSLSETF